MTSPPIEVKTPAWQDEKVSDLKTVLGYKDFPKSDARRYFVALLSVDRLKERATIHYVSQDIGCTRAEAQRALEAAAMQFGVVFERDGSVYKIASWGVLLKSKLLTQMESVVLCE